MNHPDADVDFADPHAVRDGYDPATPPPPVPPHAHSSSHSSNSSSTNTPDDTRPSTGEQDDWGFKKENRGMSTETKIGLALVVLLLCTFGFVVWKKFQKRSDVVASRFEEHTKEHEKRKPAPRNPAPDVVVDAHDHSHDGHDHPPVADPPPPRNEYAPPAVKPIPSQGDNLAAQPVKHVHGHGMARPIPDEFAFDEFEPPREPAKTHDPGFAKYEFEDDFAFDDRRPQRHAPMEEPGRLEVVDVGFDDPNVRTTAADDCPISGGGPKPANAIDADPWGDFEPIPRQGTRQAAKPVDDCPLDGGPARPADDGWGSNQFEPVDVTPRRGATEDCPLDPRDVVHGPLDQYPHGGAGQPAPNGFPAGTRIHTVCSADSYWTISRTMYGTARYFSALAKYNESRIPDPKKMRPGMKVVIPPVDALHTRYPKLCGVHGGTAAKPIAASGYFVGEDGAPRYRVGERDTLSGIAHAHLGRASRWVQLYEMNRQTLPRPDNLRVGTVIVLPGDASSVRLVRTAQQYR